MTRTFPLLRHGLLAVLTSAALVLAFSPGADAQHRRGGGGTGGGKPAAAGPTAMVRAAAGRAEALTPDPLRPLYQLPPVRRRTADPRMPSLVGSRRIDGTSRSGNSASGATAARRLQRQFGVGQTDFRSAGRVTAERPLATLSLVRRIQPVAARRSSSRAVDTVGITRGVTEAWASAVIPAHYDPWWYARTRPFTVGAETTTTTARCDIKVKPRDASVYVDGYFAGTCRRFRRRLSEAEDRTGATSCGTRLDGYETLAFEVRIDPDRKIKYTGNNKELP